MITFEDVKRLDINSEFLGVPPETLMENAGRAVAEEISSRCEGDRVVVLVGPGNNGGDGLVAARYLSEGEFHTEVVLARGEVKTPLSKANLTRLPPHVKRHTYTSPEELEKVLEGSSVVVDALLGVGIRGEMREPYKSIVEVASRSEALKVAVDVPTGMGKKVQFKADLTVTFHDVKEGMTPSLCGEIVVKDIGIPPEAEIYTGPGELALLPPTPKEGHKGDGGVVLVVGGGPYTGAPVFSSTAALKGGADLVFLAVPEGAHSLLAGRVPEVITIPLPTLSPGGLHLDMASLSAIKRAAERHSPGAILVGPGAGREPVTLEVMKRVMEWWDGALTVDADGISALCELATEGFSFSSPERVVITPHRGEYARLTRAVGLEEAEVRRISERLGATLLLKGPRDVIASPERMRHNLTGNQGMTVGGTGDILSGLVVAFLSRGMRAFDACSLAAFSIGLFGDEVFSKKGYSLLPTDILEAYFLPEDPRGLFELSVRLERGRW